MLRGLKVRDKPIRIRRWDFRHVPRGKLDPDHKTGVVKRPTYESLAKPLAHTVQGRPSPREGRSEDSLGAQGGGCQVGTKWVPGGTQSEPERARPRRHGLYMRLQ